MAIDYGMLQTHCVSAELKKVVEELRKHNDDTPIDREALNNIVESITELCSQEPDLKRKKNYETILRILKDISVFDYEVLELHCREANIVEAKRALLKHIDILPIKQDRLNALAELIKREFISATIDTASKEKYTEIVHVLKTGKISLVAAEPGREKLHVYISREQADKAEWAAQRKVSNQFWRVAKSLRDGSPSDVLYRLIAQQCVRPEAERQPIVINGYSSRALILALVKTFPKFSGYPLLKFQLGESILVCDPKEGEGGQYNQMANHWVQVTQLPDERFTYGKWQTATKIGVFNYLSKLCGSESAEKRGLREKQLAICIQRKSRVFSSFSIEDFNEHFLIKIEDEAPFSLTGLETTQQKEFAEARLLEHIHYLNGLLFLYTECEVSRRLYRTQSGCVSDYEDLYNNRPRPEPRASDSMPMGILQARSLELLAQGIVSLNNLFGHSTEEYGETTEWIEKRTKRGAVYSEPKDGADLHRAAYGVATGKSTIEHIKTMKGKATRVNRTIENKITKNLQTFFVAIDFELEKIKLPIKEGCNKQKTSLGMHFGGLYDGDSSGRDYSDNEIENLGRDVGGMKLGGK